MIQTYTMILWSKPYDAEIDEMTDICFRVLSELKNYGPELLPKYLTVWKKSDAKEFDFSKENIKQQLEKNTNKEGDLVFYDLGRSISFFSSLNDGLSCGISLRVGMSNPKFVNSLVVDLPYTKFSGFDDRLDEFEALFKRLISILNPYFAFISNSLNNQLSDTFWENGRPTYVHWMNYYDKALAENIGIENLLKVKQCEPMGEGFFLKLMDKPLNIDNQEHLDIQRLISEQLGLLD